MSRVLLPWSHGMLPADARVAKKIAAIYPDLSHALQVFASYVLKEPMKICASSINQVADDAGVSVATANRLARALNYESYAAFRQDLALGITPMQEGEADLRQNAQAAPRSIPQVIRASLAEDVTNLQDTIRSLDADLCASAVDLLAGARRIMMLGSDNAGALGIIFGHRLATLGCEIISPMPGGGALTISREIARLGPTDLLVSIAFPRYLRDTVTMTEFAASRGLPVLAITDGPTSPLCPLSKIAIWTHAKRNVTATSDAAVLAMLEAIAAGVARVKPGAAEAAQQMATLGNFWARSEK